MGVAYDQFAKESGEEKHTAQDHHQNTDMEIRIDAEQHRRAYCAQGMDLHADHYTDSYGTYQEHQATDESEEVHRLLAELVEEPYRHQVQIAVHKAAHAELRHSELAFAVLNNFFTNLGESGVLSQIRYVPVHLAEDLDVLNNLLASCS